MGGENLKLPLEDGQRVAVVGGGPSGSFFAYFLLLFAERAGLDVGVDIYEPRDFSSIGPAGCNMCGGIISESLVQSLAMEGVDLPETVIQRGIDSYVMHTEAGVARIETPTHEKRIAAVHRGGGPRTARSSKWGSFDAHLLNLATAKGAKVCRARVKEVRWKEGKPELQAGTVPPQVYDLLVGAIGVNTPELRSFEALGFGYRRPAVVKTFITELEFGAETVKRLFGSSMHVFLLNLPKLDFAALIPKGDYVTLCMLGEIDKDLVASFLSHPAVKCCFPEGWEPAKEACHCSPKMYFGAARQPFTDRVVMIGDCGVARLYKDGIGAAFRTARAAARTSVFEGVSAASFRKGFLPEFRNIQRDNLFGKAVFTVVHLMKHLDISSHAILRLVVAERNKRGSERRMSAVLWDMFTGSSPYRDIFYRTLHPMFLIRFTSSLVQSLVVNRPGREAGVMGKEI